MYFYMPEIGIGACALVALLLGVAVPYQILLALLVLTMIHVMRRVRRFQDHDVVASSVCPQIESPKQFSDELVRFCAKQVPDFSLVPERLTVPGPTAGYPGTSLVPPCEVELYFGSSGSLAGIVTLLTDFLVVHLGCEIEHSRNPGPGSTSCILEARQSGRRGRYVVSVSPALVRQHFRIQVGRVLPGT